MILSVENAISSKNRLYPAYQMADLYIIGLFLYKEHLYKKLEAEKGSKNKECSTP